MMVKPDGVQRGLIGEVLNRIERRGLKIVAMRMNTMSLDSAKKHYAEHAQKPFFGSLISFITSGPSVSMVVEGKNAISVMRAVNGATNPVNAATGSIRGASLLMEEPMYEVPAATAQPGKDPGGRPGKET